MGVSKELQREIRSVLGDLVNGKPGGRIMVHLNMNPLTRDAINYLDDIGAFEKMGTSAYRVTAFGREYYEKLTAPRRYWFKQNWFPAIVAGIAIVTSVAGIAVNVVFKILE